MATTDADKSAWWWGCSRRRRPAGTLISWRGSCSRPAAVSTPSVRRGMRATPWLRWRRVRRIRPCSTTARGVLRGPSQAGARVDASPRRTAGADGLGGRAHSGWSAQGLRPSRPGRHPADLHGCLSSPEGCWAGCRTASGPPAQSGLRVARGRGRGVLLRRRLGEPLHRSGRHQHRPRYGLPRPARTDSVRLRRQRLRHLGADAEGLDRSGVRVPAGLAYVAADGSDPAPRGRRSCER